MMTVIAEITDSPEDQVLAELLLEPHQSREDYQILILAHYNDKKLKSVELNTYSHAALGMCKSNRNQYFDALEEPNTSFELHPSKLTAVGIEPKRKVIQLTPELVQFVGSVIRSKLEKHFGKD